jgi:hypothetical protein
MGPDPLLMRDPDLNSNGVFLKVGQGHDAPLLLYKTGDGVYFSFFS